MTCQTCLYFDPSPRDEGEHPGFAICRHPLHTKEGMTHYIKPDCEACPQWKETPQLAIFQEKI